MPLLIAVPAALSRVSISAGRAVIRAGDTVVRLEEILALRAAGDTPEEIALAFPGLTPADVVQVELLDRGLAYGPA